MIAARSLPATDTTRLLGLDDFIRSPNVRALRSWAETVKFVEEEPGSEGSSEQYSFLSALLSDWSYHSLAMMPVRAGRDPVSIVEWPGQVSVAAWLWYPPGNTTPVCRRCNPALNSGRYSVNRSAENSSTEIATMIRGRAIDCASEAAATAATMIGNSALNFMCALSLHSTGGSWFIGITVYYCSLHFTSAHASAFESAPLMPGRFSGRSEEH